MTAAPRHVRDAAAPAPAAHPPRETRPSALPSSPLPPASVREHRTAEPNFTAEERVTGWTRLSRFGIGPLLLALDLVAVGGALVVAEWIGREVGEDSPFRKTAAFAVVFLLAMGQAGLYRSRLALSVLDDLPALVGRWGLAAGVAVIGQIVWSNALWRDYIIDWRFLAGAAGVGVVVIVFRAAGYAMVRRLRSRRLVAHRTLIVGAGRVGHQVADILREHPEYGLHPIGFLDGDPRVMSGPSRLPVLGGPAALPAVLEGGRVNNVVVAFSTMKESEMVRLIRTCDRFRCELFVVPRLFELHQVDGEMDTAWGLPLVRLRRSTYRSRTWRMKRLFDIAFAGGALFVLAPLMLLLALAVRLDGGPGVFFRQERVGVDGRTFEVLKFRSLRPAGGEAATTWNIADDPRLSRFGRILRKTSFDELPQLINILRGDMSVVGPRPERPHFVEEFRNVYPSYEARHRVPSGLTGWAQIHGLRGDTSIADRARFDNYYIENWSLWLDVKIILRTVGSVVRGAGG
ncbi:exopolysaccharide biosynthesis polyprenyl glycosylphosphotransferase [Trujillonella endophytica]|uniref:Undecaprenyl-phosphate glucose phosphotransferase n=1 Tax=Trujillonella endophytica TaxID=673521 RepID=A0A1H8W180_9ACTN|nr:exopolysaccharide biosynthesis polyprenyl glycosylphosphotransferase [Trujillella endophytica]SEP21273.1 Undecaprenyl-phosphate glucose phosphotransferase [Trujillella endophytica]